MICKNRECKAEFTPQYRNGVLISPYCPDCRYKTALQKRRDKTNVTVKKVPKIALKTKLKKIDSGGRNSKVKLDTVFSIFIRQRDAQNNGFGNCISCGRPVFWKNADCGHYNNRKHMATRYDEVNCNLQCRACNRFDEGNMSGYRHGLIKKYGEEKVIELEMRKFNKAKISKVELELLIDHYQKINAENILKNM